MIEVVGMNFILFLHLIVLSFVFAKEVDNFCIDKVLRSYIDYAASNERLTNER
jgi:hypothetical protein